MTMSKMTLLGMAGIAAAAISSGTLAWVVHNRPATADHENLTIFDGQDARIFGATPNASIRSQWEREGLPH
jgi:hypothetical protein